MITTGQRRRLDALEFLQDNRVPMPAALERRRAGLQARPGDEREIVVWALRLGLGHDTAAGLIGVTATELDVRMREDEELATACRQAVAEGRALVAAKLLERVRSGDARAISLWLQARVPEFGDGARSDDEVVVEPDPRFE